MVVRVGMRELRHNTRVVIERSIAEDVVEISDRDSAVGYLLSPASYHAARVGAPRLSALAALIERQRGDDTGAWEELMIPKRTDLGLEKPAP